jgi:hypothetical protein
MRPSGLSTSAQPFSPDKEHTQQSSHTRNSTITRHLPHNHNNSIITRRAKHSLATTKREISTKQRNFTVARWIKYPTSSDIRFVRIFGKGLKGSGSIDTNEFAIAVVDEVGIYDPEESGLVEEIDDDCCVS